jgi:DNA polymerase I-like protein with 3'-5' exonuclease and polymerase domains
MSAALQYRASLGTCLQTFMRPWLAVAQESNGLIFTNWNQVRGENGGASTGRLSSSPNFQNIPKAFAPLWDHEQKGLPKCPVKDLPSLPLVRSYIVPWDAHHVLIGRDFSSQEVRIMAHFEDGPLQDAYRKDRYLDPHQFASDLITQMLRIQVPRDKTKTIAFSILYGSGIAKLAESMGVDYASGEALKEAYMKVLPGVATMLKEVKFRARSNQPIRTWGGRVYYVEAPKIVKGKLQTFDYKMFNILMQGSAADATKQAIIDYAKTLRPDDRFYLNVHDELLSSVRKNILVEGMAKMKLSMNALRGFDVPMESDGKISETNWAQMTTYDKKGVLAP